jgi:hypothetical protein
LYYGTALLHNAPQKLSIRITHLLITTLLGIVWLLGFKKMLNVNLLS